MTFEDNNSLPGVILLAHGSREPEAGAEIRDLCFALSGSKPGWRFEHAFLNQDPRMDQAAKSLISLGCRRVYILPLLVFKGRHLLEDIPDVVKGLKKLHPGIAFEIKSHLSGLAGFKDLILKELESHTFRNKEA